MCVALAGCAHAPPPSVPSVVELTTVPFFPQTDYQCGPAALATVLAHAGLAVTADELVDDVYIAGLRGTLQAELLGATRRRGLVPYVIAPDINTLLAELTAGSPVLVLQNLGLERFPVWHYAVVVGYDGRSVILRSGTDMRRTEPLRKFQRSWQRGASWALVVAPPGALPATAVAPSYLRALAAAEPLFTRDAAERGYATALERWPLDELVLFGAANQRHAAGDLAGATALYSRLLGSAPTHAVARNNLANVLAERGCYTAALREARAALATTAVDATWREAILDTVATLERAPGGTIEPTACSKAVVP